MHTYIHTDIHTYNANIYAAYACRSVGQSVMNETITLAMRLRETTCAREKHIGKPGRVGLVGLTPSNCDDVPVAFDVIFFLVPIPTRDEQRTLS